MRNDRENIMQNAYNDLKQCIIFKSIYHLCSHQPDSILMRNDRSTVSLIWVNQCIDKRHHRARGEHTCSMQVKCAVVVWNTGQQGCNECYHNPGLSQMVFKPRMFLGDQSTLNRG